MTPNDQGHVWATFWKKIFSFWPSPWQQQAKIAEIGILWKFTDFCSFLGQISVNFQLVLAYFFQVLTFSAVSRQNNLQFKPKLIFLAQKLRFLAQKLTILERFQENWKKLTYSKEIFFCIKFWIFSTFLIPKWRKTTDFSGFWLF